MKIIKTKNYNMHTAQDVGSSMAQSVVPILDNIKKAVEEFKAQSDNMFDQYFVQQRIPPLQFKAHILGFYNQMKNTIETNSAQITAVVQGMGESLNKVDKAKI